MKIPEEIIDAIFEYERYILMKEHFEMFKYVLQDIGECVKVILNDHHWHKQYSRPIDDDYHLKFIYKQGWTQQSLEGAATCISRGQII